MESQINDTRLPDELEFVKAHAARLATLRVETPSHAVPAEAPRPHIVAIPVTKAPEPVIEDAPAFTPLTLHLKSTKPALAFDLAVDSDTVTVAQLKARLAAENAGAPPADAQRWILKGKALNDAKLLKEFSIADGATINLMVKAGWTPPADAAEATAADAAGALAASSPAAPTSSPGLTATPAPPPIATAHSRQGSLSARSPHTRVPSLSITSSDISPASPVSSATRHASHSSVSASEHFVSTISSPALWKDALALLEQHFGDSLSARKAFETWLSSSMVWISASDKARIREEAGVSAMGGF